MNSVLEYYHTTKENVKKERRRRQSIQRGNHEKARNGVCSDQRI